MQLRAFHATWLANCERGLSAVDFRQRLTASFLFELSFGRVTFQDGFPLTAYCGGGNIRNGGGLLHATT
jgi:hypothetical protein